jgi:polysaccharide export outer membrane protein
MKIWFFLLVLLVGCGVASPGLAEIADYELGAGDVIKIEVYDNSDLSTVARISAVGAILFPLVGEVQVGGKTIPQVVATLSERLADGYIVNPQISVFVEQFRSKKVVIMGEIGKPGLYELSGPTTILQLISTAGGLTKDAGDFATITGPDTAGEERSVNVELKSLLASGSTERMPPLRDGDRIFVVKAGMFYVTGEVRNSAAYRLEEGTTLIKAITVAGGFSPIAAKGKIRIIRKIDGQEQTLKNVSMNELIQAEDVIVVPESFF